MSDIRAVNLPPDKQSLRRAIRAARRGWRDAAPESDVAVRAEGLARTVCADPSVRTACTQHRVVTCFASLPTEPPTSRLLDRLIHEGADVLLPIVTPHRVLHWARYEQSGSLEPATLGIPEPTGEPLATNATELLALNPAVMLIPALAVDLTRTRLGQGGGYYDTVLDQLPRANEGGPEVIALVGPGEVFDAAIIPREAHDREVDRWIVG